MSASPISDFAEAASPAASYDSSTHEPTAPSEGARLARQSPSQDGRPCGRPMARRETGVVSDGALLEGETPSLPTPADARAARLEKFKWEQAIVDDLNRGASIGEIAARVGFSEARMGATVHDILARRMPAHEDFAAIQPRHPLACRPEAMDAGVRGHGDEDYERPENLPQGFEKMESGSRIAGVADIFGGVDAAREAAFAPARLAPGEGGSAPGAAGRHRPGIPAASR